MTQARLLSADDHEGGFVRLLMEGTEIRAMNCMGYDKRADAYPAVGSTFTPSFTCLFDDDAPSAWDDVFQGNPDQRSELVRTGPGSYRVFGQIVAVDTEDVDAQARCGPCVLPLPIEVSDPACLGLFVAYDVLRLDVWRTDGDDAASPPDAA